MAHHRILLVDDEANIRAVLARALKLSGYRVEEAPSGTQALAMLESKPYDLMILDIQMPGPDGVEVMQRARQLSPELLVIILTGHGSLQSAIAAVKSEAVDYLLKPAGIQQIVTAVKQALEGRSDRLRRNRLLHLVGDAIEELNKMSAPAAPSAAVEDEPYLSAGPFALDRRRRVLIGPCGPSQPVDLSESEAAVMQALITHADRVLSCRELARLAWNYDLEEDEARSLLRQYIFRLRRKIETDPGHPRWIRTVRGTGYYFGATSPDPVD